jgi:hypothetical protein
MFDRGNFAIGNLRIACDLRRRRNGNGKRNLDGRHRSHVVGNIDLDGNLADVGRIDILRHGANLGVDGNVRLRLEQHCRFVEPNVNAAHHKGRSNRNSAGFYSNQQFRRQCRNSCTAAEHIAHGRCRPVDLSGTGDADSRDAKYDPVKRLYL